MTGIDEAPLEDGQSSSAPGKSRRFWTATALGIAAILLSCTALILIAATRS